MWIKSEADRKLYNMELAHTLEVLKQGSKYYVVALFQGSSVNTHAHLGDAHVAQLSLGRSEEEAHQVLSKITRSFGENVLNLDTAEARKKAPGGAASSSPALRKLLPMGGTEAAREAEAARDAEAAAAKEAADAAGE